MGRIVPLQCPEGPRLTHLQDFSDRFMALDFRWDEKADPPRSTLCCVGLQAYASSMWAQNGRRIGP
jgi:hypothetical protein